MSPNHDNSMSVDAEDLDILLRDIATFTSAYYQDTQSTIRPLLDTITTNRDELRLHSSLPTSSRSVRSTTDEILQKIVPSLVKQSNPHYYGFVTGGTIPAALIADLIVTAIDQNAAVHLPRDAIHTQIEKWAISMLCELYELPVSTWAAGGTFTTGATTANILGLACGREYLLRNEQTGQSVSELGYLRAAVEKDVTGGIKIITATPHSSIAKAASIVGLGANCCIDLPSSRHDPWNFDLQALEKLLEKQDEDRVRYIIVPGFAEVNTGRFTGHIAHISQLCVKYGAWLHIDAAFGLFARCFKQPLEGHLSTDENAEIYKWASGLELADSITGDCHKLLNVPYDCGVFFTRHADLLKAVCNNPGAAYLATPVSTSNGTTATTQAQEIEIISPCNVGLENSRRFRALPVYAALTTYGKQGYQEMIARFIIHAREIATWISKSQDYELLMKDLSKVYTIVLFRARDELLNKRLVGAINDTGKLWVSGTTWNGASAVRIAVANWRVGVHGDEGGAYSSKVVTDVLKELSKS